MNAVRQVRAVANPLARVEKAVLDHLEALYKADPEKCAWFGSAALGMLHATAQSPNLTPAEQAATAHWLDETPSGLTTKKGVVRTKGNIARGDFLDSMAQRGLIQRVVKQFGPMYFSTKKVFKSSGAGSLL